MVAVPTPLDWLANAGQFATAAMLDAGVADPLTFLLDPPLCIAKQTVAQSIPTAAYTSITFTGEDVDNEATASHLSGTGMHDTVTNTSRFTCRTPGRYLLSGAISWTLNATGRRGLTWRVNGVGIAYSQVIHAAGSTAEEFPARVMYASLAVGDYVELACYQDTGAALSIASPSGQAGTHAMVRWVGP